MEVKSRIEARSEALGYACVFLKDRVEVTSEMVITFAKVFEQYIIGNVNLPEKCKDESELVSDYLEKITQSMRETREAGAYGLMGHNPTSC